MTMVMRVYDIENDQYIEDLDKLMEISGQDPRKGFEAVAIREGDGTPIICDKCGNFRYLDPKKYRVKIIYD